MVAPEITLFVINACVHFFLFGAECYDKCRCDYVIPLHVKITTCIVSVLLLLVLLVMLGKNFDLYMWKDWTIFCGLLVFSAWSTSGWKLKEPS